MNGQRLQGVLAPVAGLGVGYLAWIGTVAAVAATVPVHLWVVVTAVALVLLGTAAFLLGRRSATRAARQFFWWSPLLPALASLYVLALLAF